MMLPNAPTQSFPYQVEGKIGEGGMGYVYRAHEPSLGRKVAIKILRQDMLAALAPRVAREAIQRFTQEARAAAALTHPGITTIYRVGVVNDIPYIAMEWLDGETLEQKILAHAPLELNQVLRWALTLLEALQQAHEAGVVHRDIKPANLMITQDMRIRVTDFGVAHVDQSELVSTQANMILGTPLYASPEQIRGEPVDARSDIYSVAVVLYEALTGKLPFDASGIFELAEMLRSSSPLPLSSHVPGIPRQVEQVVLRALSREASARYGSAREMLEALAPLTTFDTSSTGWSAYRPSPKPPAPVLKQEAMPPTLLTASAQRMHMVSELVQSWKGQAFGAQPPAVLIARVLERPLHTSAFAGALKFGDRFFLIYDGLIYAAFRLSTGEVGDLVYETLGRDEAGMIFAVPEYVHAQVILLLSSLMHPARQPDHETSSVSPGALAQELTAQRFSGAIHLSRGPARGFILMWQGENIFNIFSGGWPDEVKTQPWRTWIDSAQARADVEQRRTLLPAFAYREELKGFGFAISPAAEPDADTIGGAPGEPLLRVVPMPADASTNRAARGEATLRHLYRSDPVFAFMCWMLTGMASYFKERSLARGWKYLAGWTELVRTASMHHALHRPQSRQEDFFDLVTRDEQGKVLHVVDHLSRVGPDELRAFVEKAKAAKSARDKSGDIGGAILVARDFLPEAFAVYAEFIAEPEKSSLLYTIQSSLMRYSGFVRIGPTRGFHLLLVRESSQGFEPLIGYAR